MRIRVRPTELGWKGLLLFGALAGAFFATAYSNTFFLMLAFCGALGALSCWWTVANVRGLRVVRIDVPAAAAGAPRPVRVQLHAARPRRDLGVTLDAGGTWLAVGELPVAAGPTGFDGGLPARRRGIETTRVLRLTSRFPLGLFAASVDLPVDAEIVTPPAPAADGAAARRGGGDAEHSSHRGERGSSVQELRPFRAGDGLGDVHWKATARRGTAVVKERDRRGGREQTVVLDRRCDPDALERALADVARLAARARDGGAPLRVVSQGLDFTTGRERTAAPHLLRWLAGATPIAADGGEPPRVPGALRLGGRAPAGGDA